MLFITYYDSYTHVHPYQNCWEYCAANIVGLNICDELSTRGHRFIRLGSFDDCFQGSRFFIFNSPDILEFLCRARSQEFRVKDT